MPSLTLPCLVGALLFWSIGGLTEVFCFLFFFFLTEKEKDETIKKDRPYKIFFKDLFLYKENEMAAKKRVR